MKRLKAFWMLLRLRSEGLDELIETLHDMIEFYQQGASYKPPPKPKNKQYHLVEIDDE